MDLVIVTTELIATLECNCWGTPKIKQICSVWVKFENLPDTKYNSITKCYISEERYMFQL